MRPSQKKKQKKQTWRSKRGYSDFPPPEPARNEEVVVYSKPSRGQFLPNVFINECTYADIYADTTAGGFVDWIYRGNSAYDPDYGAGGGRAIGFSQMSGMYGNYKVTASSAELTVVNNDTDDPVFMCLTPSTTATAFTIGDIEPIISRPRVKWTIAAQVQGSKKITHASTTKSLFDVKDLDEDTYGATVGANPTSAWYWHLTLFNKSGNALNCVWAMKIRYTVRWSALAQAFVQ
jgi:hypothetical protein